MNEGCLVMMLDIFRAHYSVLLASINRLEFIMERLAPILIPDTTLQTLTDRGGDTIRPRVTERYGGDMGVFTKHTSFMEALLIVEFFFFYKQFLETCLRDCDLRVDQSRDK